MITIPKNIERRRRVIALAEKEQIKPVLDRFMRIDTGRLFWFELGGDHGAGSFEAGHSDEEKGKLADHPAARARARLSPGGPGRAADRPGLLTGARDGAARVYCMIMNQM